MAGTEVCFTSLSSITGFSYAQYNYQKECWNIWNKIEANNSNVSTFRGNGQLDIQYYQYETLQEKNKFDNGLALHVQYLGGYININPVQKN